MQINWRQYIHADAAILGGKPVIKGTRISVELLTERLANGWTAEDIRASYPHLPAEALAAVFRILAGESGVEFPAFIASQVGLMQFLADENFPCPSVRALRDAGLDVAAIQEMAPSIVDSDVVAMAQRLERTILTFDRDFGELVFKHGLQPLAGIVYFRALDYRPAEPAQWLLALLASDSELSFRQKFTTLTPEMSRQREY